MKDLKDDIENFEAKKPVVERVGRKRIVAWVGGARPAVGSTLWVGTTAARICGVLEERRVEAIVFDEARIKVGDAVRHSAEEAQWPQPRPGKTVLSQLSFEPGGRAASDISAGRQEAIETGIEFVDTWTPLVRYGTNVILDVGATAERFDRLVRAAADGPVVAATHLEHELDVAYEVSWSAPQDAELARRVAVHWVRMLNGERGTLVLDADVDVDLDTLVDAASGATIFVRVAVDEDLHPIVETLDLGTFDAQIVLRADGTIDFGRSTSRLGSGRHSEEFSRVEELKERLALFGVDELEADDLELLERAELAERILIR